MDPHGDLYTDQETAFQKPVLDLLDKGSSEHDDYNRIKVTIEDYYLQAGISHDIRHGRLRGWNWKRRPLPGLLGENEDGGQGEEGRGRLLVKSDPYHHNRNKAMLWMEYRQTYDDEW